MTTIKVHFEAKQGNKNEVETNISGTPEDISRFYLDKWFNFPDYENIVLKLGDEAGKQDIVREYMENKSYYDNLESY